ncbi:MAG: class I SAM-dependent methyltransferase [Candidatus Magasanikiibacteriota bacterium]
MNAINNYEVVVQKDELGNIKSSLDYFLKLNIPKEAKILDIGCNYGSLIFNLYNLGYKNVFGIEINRMAVEKGKHVYSSIVDNINTHEAGKIPFDNNSFDAVLMFDVIEHIPNVQDFLKNEVYRVLKKDGTFIFQTPNKYINIPWEIINQHSFSKWKEYHCSLQTKYSLLKIFKKVNFKKIRLEKEDILTKHNINKVYKKIGFLSKPVLYLLRVLPLFIYPNFYGNCRK